MYNNDTTKYERKLENDQRKWLEIYFSHFTVN